ANGWRKLPGVKTDIEQVSEALRKQGFNVITKLNPTQEELDKALRDFTGDYGVKQRNRLLIWFAGHGHTENLSDGREQGYIVPLDAPDPSRDLPGFRRRAVSMNQVEAYALGIESKHVLFIFDSCFSGAIFDVRSGNTVPPEIESKIAGPVRLFIASGTKDQKVPDDSMFRNYFVRALDGEGDLNSDGYVVGEELGIYLSGRVASDSRESQTPRYGRIKDARLNIGDFVFVLPRRPGTSPQTAGSTMTPDATLLGEQALWNEIVGSNDPVDFDEFLKAYPNGVYANAARARLKKLTTKTEEPPRTGGTVSAAPLLLQAENALKRIDFDGALRSAEEALKIEPQNAIAHRLRGEACFGKRIPECWNQEVDTILQLTTAPRNAREYEARAWANRYKRNPDQALGDINESLRLDARFAWAYYSRGGVLMARREIDAAIADYTRAVSLEPDGVIYYQARASAYGAARNYDMAIADYSKAISLNSNDVAIWRGRALMYQAKKDYARAVEDLTRAIGLDPTGYTNYFARGNVRRELNQTDLAISDYSRAIQLNPNYGLAYGERAKLYRLTGKIELAEADERKAAEFSRRPPPVSAVASWIARAEDGLRNRRFDEVLRLAEEQLAKEPQNAIAIRLKSEVVTIVKKDLNARNAGIQTVLKLLTGKSLRDSRELEARAWALLSANKARGLNEADYDLVIEDCNQAIRLDPRFDLAYLLRGNVWRLRQQYERAIADYSRAIELYPNIGSPRRLRAGVYVQKKDYDSAIADFTVVIKLEATMSDYYRRGDLYGEKGDYRNAIADYTSAIKLDDDYWPAYEKRAQAYRRVGSVARAEADEQKVRELKK
ncbi:MAG TPA: tetratricopeptide repeat protein, partial [Blastocatellia bacterium]|nr:tetratricopeptide repeat protein [Blastocatellia bacterium]